MHHVGCISAQPFNRGVTRSPCKHEGFPFQPFKSKNILAVFLPFDLVLSPPPGRNLFDSVPGQILDASTYGWLPLFAVLLFFAFWRGRSPPHLWCSCSSVRISVLRRSWNGKTVNTCHCVSNLYPHYSYHTICTYFVLSHLYWPPRLAPCWVWIRPIKHTKALQSPLHNNNLHPINLSNTIYDKASTDVNITSCLYIQLSFCIPPHSFCIQVSTPPTNTFKHPIRQPPKKTPSKIPH